MAYLNPLFTPLSFRAGLTRDEFMCLALWLELDIWAFGSLERSCCVVALQNLTLFSTMQQAKDFGWEVFSCLGAVSNFCQTWWFRWNLCKLPAGNIQLNWNGRRQQLAGAWARFTTPPGWRCTKVPPCNPSSALKAVSLITQATPLVLEFLPVLC
jgi:hypothetical protein